MSALALPRSLSALPGPVLLLSLAIIVGAIALLPLSLAAGLVLGIASLLLTLARLEYGLVLLAFTVPFGSLGEIEAGDFSLSSTEFIVPLVVLAWVMRIVAAREVRLSLPWIVWPLVLFLSAMALSFTNATSLGLSFKEMAKWLEFLAILILVGNTIKEKGQVKLLLAAILVAGVLAGLHGWYQFVLRDGPGSFLVSDRFLRAYGFYGQPNPYAGYLLSVAPVSIVLALVATSERLPRRPVLAALGVVTAAILMTLSRGGMIGLAGASVLIGAMRTMFLRKYLVLVILLFCLLGLAASYEVLPVLGDGEGGALAEFGVFDPSGIAPTPQNWSVVERMALWYSAWEMWEDSPWLGIGIGNFRAVYPDYALKAWDFGQVHAHNYYLNILTEGGAVGLAAYLVFLASLFVYVTRNFKAAMAHGWHLGSAVVLGVLATLVALSLHNFFDNIYVHGMLVQMGILLGLIPVAARMGEAGA